MLLALGFCGKGRCNLSSTRWINVNPKSVHLTTFVLYQRFSKSTLRKLAYLFRHHPPWPLT